MQVMLEKTSGLERRLKIIVPAKNVDDAVKKRLKQLTRTVRIDGFRPGKVPVSLIKKRYSGEVRQEVINSEMQNRFNEVVKQEELNLASSPSVENIITKEGSDIEFHILFEVYPEIKMIDFEQLKIKKPKASILDSDIDNLIQMLRKQSQTFEKVDRLSRNGDEINFDFVGSIDGAEFEGGKAEKFNLVLGSKKMIPGFEEKLLDMKKGDNKKFAVTFPEDYPEPTLKGKLTTFDVTINEVKQAVLPEVNEDFFKKFGITDGGEEKFKSEIESNMKRELDQSTKKIIKKQVIAGLVDLFDFEIPNSMVKQEILRLRERKEKQNYKVDYENTSSEAEAIDAEKKVKVSLIIGEVIKNNELKVKDENVKEKLKELSSLYESPNDVYEHYFKNKEQMAKLKHMTLEDQVIDFIVERSDVQEEDSSYKQVLETGLKV